MPSSVFIDRSIGPDVDRWREFVAIFAIECILTVCIMVLRFWAKIRRRQVVREDWIMLAAWVSHLIFTIISIVLAVAGGTRHLVYLQLDPARAIMVTKLNWIAQPFGIVGLGLGKVAVALFILRVSDRGVPLWWKWVVHTIIGLTILFMVFTVALLYGQCTDPTALWDPKVKERTECWDPSIQKNFSIFSASWNCFVDLFFALLPITLVYKLHMKLRKKIGVCMLMGLGVFTGVCAILKIRELNTMLIRSDITWVTFKLFVWTNTEGAVVIICGSIPTINRSLRGDRSDLYRTTCNASSFTTHLGSMAHSQNGQRTNIRSTVSGNSRKPKRESEFLSDSDSESFVWGEKAIDKIYVRQSITQTIKVVSSCRFQDQV